MRGRDAFTIAVPGGLLGGWLAGAGPPVLLLHGGPGLSFEYLDELGDELATDFRLAAYQQRGLEPSTLNGPFTIVGGRVTEMDLLVDPVRLERVQLREPPEA